jgi:prepilin-type N-terminal cleavage/methylation domain-containing protein
MDQRKYQHKQVGFTLFELILVVTLISILSAFVLHRYIEMRHSAHIWVLKGTKLSLQGALNLVHAKALITGVENKLSASISINLADPFAEDIDIKPFLITTRYGYPQGIWQDLTTIAELDQAKWFYVNQPASSANIAGLYIWTKEGPGSISTCNIFYQGALKSGDRPKIIINETGC